MLTRTTRIQLVAFAVIAVLVIGYTGFHYANLGRLFGLRGYYTVQMDLANAGGIFPQADVTYRGVSVGRVGAVRLTPTGVEADLNISNSAPPIPADLHGQRGRPVRRRRAVRQPAAGHEQRALPHPGQRDPAQRHHAPAAGDQPADQRQRAGHLGAARRSARRCSTIWPPGSAAQSTSLQALIDGQSKLVRAAGAALPQTDTLIQDGQTVLATQNAEAAAFRSFAASSRLFAGQLVASDADLRRLFANGAPAATQVAGLITDNTPTLGALIANLLTTSQITLTRGAALQETFSALPAAIAAGSTVITNKGARFGVALTFFNPLPCTAGYQGTKIRNGLDTSPGPPLNTKARCTSPASSGIDVRGSAHTPAPAASSPLAGLLGLSP